MEIIQITSFGLIAAFIAVILKGYKSDYALYITIISGIIIFSFVLGKLELIFDLINTITQKADINIIYINTVLKIIGIAYITEFASEVCKDADQGTIALKLEFAGKVLIVGLAFPIIYALIDLIARILP